MPDLSSLYRFGPVAAPVAFHGCDDLVPLIAGRMHGWRITPWPDAGEVEPALAVTRQSSEYELRSRFMRKCETYDDAPKAAMAFFAELIMAYGAEAPNRFFLHAAGVVVQDFLFAFPAPGRTGKSTLTAQLAASGARIFSDDVLPLDVTTARAGALGIDPRLRLPLPVACSEAFRSWLARRKTLANSRYAYVTLPRHGPGALAPLGEERPVAAFIQLQREENVRATLAPCRRADIVALLIRQHFGGTLPMPRVVARFKGIVEATPCYRLTYADGAEAVEALDALAAAA